MESPSTTCCNYNVWLSLEQNGLMLHAETFIRKTVYIPHVYGIQKKTAVYRLNTDIHRLTTGIRSEKCVVRRFRLANLYLHKPS